VWGEKKKKKKKKKTKKQKKKKKKKKLLGGGLEREGRLHSSGEVEPLGPEEENRRGGSTTER